MASKIVEAEGSFVVDIKKAGQFALCFGNEMSVVSEKIVTIAFHFEKPQTPIDHLKTEDLFPIGISSDNIAVKINSLQKELIFMRKRYVSQYELQQQISSKALVSTLIECAVVLFVAFGQVIYIKYLVEKAPPLGFGI